MSYKENTVTPSENSNYPVEKSPTSVTKDSDSITYQENLSDSNVFKVPGPITLSQIYSPKTNRFDEFPCDHPGCNKAYARADSLRRHKNSAHTVFKRIDLEKPLKLRDLDKKGRRFDRPFIYNNEQFQNYYTPPLTHPIKKEPIFVNLYSKRLLESQNCPMLFPIQRKRFNEEGDEIFPLKKESPVYPSELYTTMRKTDHDIMSKAELKKMAETTECLIPIKIEFEIDGENSLLKDCFVWNLNEKILTPEKFAKLMCEDLNIPTSKYSTMISSAIKDQVKEHVQFYLENDRPLFPDSRIFIELDLNFGTNTFKDRFEWDLTSDLEPEEFARILAQDLGFGGELVPMIAYSIREQILRSKIEDDIEPLARLQHGFREFLDDEIWSPTLIPLSEEYFDRMQGGDKIKS
ncbi:hypothetical protein HK099_000300 [Clydaea vesicula]|uniref:C2H2-type domain-containing protein n=1 Tax=Clydaea vesicula TaxID=447962 RepID=A0AAD5TV48_9FUNG|nr:hypothetical protein HK099_000300 [Clydaea vesicula]